MEIRSLSKTGRRNSLLKRVRIVMPLPTPELSRKPWSGPEFSIASSLARSTSHSARTTTSTL